MPPTGNDLQHHAVRYTVSDDSNTGKASINTDDLKKKGIKYVRIQWVDLMNTIRYRVTPIDYFAKLLQTSRPGVTITKIVMGLVFITPAEGFGPTGEYLYAIDPATLRICPYAPGHASVMGWFQEKTPVLGLEGHRAIEVDLCPRTILRRVVENAKHRAGVEFLVGFETEFILLKNTNPMEAVNQHGWSNSPALLTGTVEAKVLEEIVDNLQDSGVEIQMYHAEAAPGQYEVIPGPLPPLQAVDALIHTRETIFNVASKYGLRATLAPRVFMDNCGNGAHAHISLHSTSTEPSPKSSMHSNLSLLESRFLSGLLEHLPEVLLLALPTTASFKRMVDGAWSGGTYVCWGTDNREAPVRLCNAGSPHSRNFEIKTHDGTANPYLSLAGFLGSGVDGILRGEECAIKDCGLEHDTSAALLGNDGREKLGIKDRLPLSWDEARKAFDASELIEEVFGSEFKKKYLGVNKVIREQMSHGLMDDEELQKYVENF